MEKESLTLMIVQQAAIYNDFPASIGLAESYLQKAKESGVDLVIFGESWLTGYPAWLDYARDISIWDDPSLKSVYAELWQNGLEIGSIPFQELSNIIKNAGVMVCIGANERVNSGQGNRSLYNALLIFDETGTLVHHHRKLMPTHTERLIHAQGDARGLTTIQTDWGKIGGLICWEHWMPLTRQALHIAGEQIHIALWPKVHEMLQIASRHYAFEGRCFVIAVGQVLKANQLPQSLLYHPEKVTARDQYVLNGQSCIFGPGGEVLLEPQGPDKLEIIFEIKDLTSVIREQMTLDVAGHYARPDIFEFSVNLAGNHDKT